MQNWEIIDDYDIEKENEHKKNSNILSDLLNDYELENDFMKKNIDQQLEEINQLIKEVNQEKVDILNSFPSCSLAIIKSLIRNDDLDDENMDIDQMSLSSSELHSSNDSPLFEAQTNMDLHQSLTDSPGSMNISDFL
ncbi:uncharacterized protein cubi_03485 [Cryptosporidium ubiquitum]|uniref:Uncharacterized protein n=1 Tax=Cryptosporidium ubiquitum TaxID=857276 RepID=A0A1J4MI42_9CRYT|nr:uncharacterized protein cubi_03485 [Cryptosporidium ubiquitum]OII73687.1 hypothetical protein cubi_03485 [Cryptosporidium ubiquitum]